MNFQTHNTINKPKQFFNSVRESFCAIFNNEIICAHSTLIPCILLYSFLGLGLCLPSLHVQQKKNSTLLVRIGGKNGNCGEIKTSKSYLFEILWAICKAQCSSLTLPVPTPMPWFLINSSCECVCCSLNQFIPVRFLFFNFAKKVLVLLLLFVLFFFRAVCRVPVLGWDEFDY